MPDLLLELFSEEIPARMQKAASENLRKGVTDALVESGLTYEGARAYVTPRRLTLNIVGISASSPDTKQEKKGPRVDAPEQAVQGFLRGAGLSSIEDAEIVSDPKKGDFYLAVTRQKGQPAHEILQQLLPKIINNFSWPKSMRWGNGSMRWVRPLRAVTAVLASQTGETEIVPFELEGLQSGNVTYGHRFMAPEPITVGHFEAYASALEKAKVVLDSDRRKEIIRTDAEQMAFAQGLSLIADEGLLSEAAGLVEWPVVLMGSFDSSFLAVPEEVIILTIRTNQKCFCLRDNDTGKLTNKFVAIANLEAPDGGATIIAGNEKVIRARLADAKFFWESDLKASLESRLPKLEPMKFHEKLGSQMDRVERIKKLSLELASALGADAEQTARAATLAKADLVTDMVFEFPELQGTMGRYYAQIQGETESVANAIETHYKPVGPSDTVPNDPVAICVALADKLDMLTSFWAIDEKPTGSKDPFALRRAALGLIRILLENEQRLSLSTWVDADLLSFIHDRLRGHLRSDNISPDHIDAVLFENADDLLMVTKRASALSNLLGTPDGENLVAGYKRATNILRAEEKKDGITYAGKVDRDAFTSAQENDLHDALIEAKSALSDAISNEDFEVAMASLATLRGPVDAFFDKVMVNDEDAKVRLNRLNLLATLRDAMHQVADFSKLAG